MIAKAKETGLTIIEVMFAMTISAVLVASALTLVPAVQRNSRDSTRKHIITSVKSALETYAADNNGLYPLRDAPTASGTSGFLACTGTIARDIGKICDFVNRYINNPVHPINVNDPSNDQPLVTGTDTSKGLPFYWYPDFNTQMKATVSANGPGYLYIVVNSKCKDNETQAVDPLGGTSVSRKFSIIISLDHKGDTFCVDNSQ